MKKIILKYGGMLAALAMVFTTLTVNSTCTWMTYQEELPETAKKLQILMFPKLSCKIADRLEYYGIVQKSNKALYEYGLRQMFATILNILTMLLIGFIMGLAVPAMVYTIAYIPLRVYAGGYHASTPQRCWAFSAIMLWIALCIVKYTPQMYFWVITTLSLIACIVVFCCRR